MKKSFHLSSAVALSLSFVIAVPACGGESASRPAGGAGGAGAGGTRNSVGGVHGGRADAGTTSSSGTNDGIESAGGFADGAEGGADNGSGRSNNAGESGATESVGGSGGTNSTGGGSGRTNGTGGDGGRTNGSGGAIGTGGEGGTAGRASGGRSGMAGGGGITTTGGTTGSAGTSGGNRVLIPSTTGWVDHEDAANDVGVQGSWYPYGDQYGNGPYDKVCLTYGQHQPSECALITSPDPTAMGFPNVNGAMHTTGTIEQVLPCVAGSMAATIPTSGCPGGGLAGGHDYGNMWGAGIAFDFNRDGGPPNGDGARHAWDPRAYGVIGIRFTIQGVPPNGFRVEFPILLTASEAAADTPPITAPSPTTEYHSAGSPYFGAKGDGTYPNSPVVEGENTITWDQIGIPKVGFYTFDPARMLGIKFHLQSTTAPAASYDFTISNLTFLRHL